MFSDIPGNDEIKNYLLTALKKGMVGNSLLFAGPKDSGKEEFAKAFASAILSQSGNAEMHLHKLKTGNHPDLHVYRPEGKTGMHSIQTMRQLSEEVYLPPYESAHKVFIVHDADRMLPTSANALLKTFEEPSLDTVIILVCTAPELLLPTILSRCRKIHFKPLETSVKSISNESDPLVQATQQLLSQGKLGSYNDLTAAAKNLVEMIESRTKTCEESLRLELLAGFTEKPSAKQRESIDKELEGVLSMQKARESHILFEAILAWHRDLLLLSVGGDPRYVFHSQALPELQKALANGRLIALSKVFSAIEEAKLSLARSTSLNLCIENLMLKLDFI